MTSRSLKSILFCLFILSGFADSQVNWERFPGNPIVPLSGNPAFEQTFAPSVLFDSVAGIYKMWFSSVLVGGSTWNVSYATSLNGTSWQVFGGSPVLRVGSSGSFDSQWLIDPFVMRIGNSYRMYYTGYDGARWQSGLATSEDGINWTKNPNNPIVRVVPGTWESVGSNCPKVYFNGSTYTMMYSGYDGANYSIGLATSIDGVNFLRNPSNPVLRKGASSEWDANSVFMNSFVQNNGKFYLLYNGGPYAPVGFATSTDGGVSWGKYPGNPVFTTGASGSWDGSRITVGSLIVTGSGFQYWYTGQSALTGKWQIGYATGSLAPPIVFPVIQVSPPQLNFGNVLVGLNATRNVMVKNISFFDTLRVSGVSSNSPFFIPDTSSFSLPPGISQNVQVHYTPFAVQTDTGSISIMSNDSTNPVVRVAVSGNGFATVAAPLINSIGDIREDQGKQVRVTWFRSLFDSASGTTPVTEYSLWRKVKGTTDLWDFIVSVPAAQFSQYSYVAPTLYDSIPFAGIRWSVFRVSAHTNTAQVFFSPPDSGYSVDNLAPFGPTNLAASFEGGRVNLAWVAPPDPDVQYFGVYRSTTPNFLPSPANQIGTSSMTNYSDQSVGGNPAYYYCITAFDTTGNQSVPSNQAFVVITDVEEGSLVPSDFRLYQNYPNPFNPSSIIRYDVPERSHVNITVYDVLGKAVAALVDEVRSAGTHSVSWNAGKIASGVYLYRMQAGSFTVVKKLVLMK